MRSLRVTLDAFASKMCACHMVVCSQDQ